MVTQPNPYLGDPNMLWDLTKSELEKKSKTTVNTGLKYTYNWLIKDHNSVNAQKLIYLGALIAHSEVELLRFNKIGKQGVREIKKFLRQVSETTGREYKLRKIIHPAMKEQITSFSHHFGLSNLQSLLKMFSKHIIYLQMP